VNKRSQPGFNMCCEVQNNFPRAPTYSLREVSHLLLNFEEREKEETDLD